MKISSEAYTLMNMAFDISGIIVLILVVCSMLQKHFEDRKTRGFLIVAVIHLLALFMLVARAADTLINRGKTGISHMMTALALDAVSIGILIFLIMSDSEGRMHLVHRKDPISLPMVLFLIVPNMLAFLVEILTKNIRMLGMAYAVSLYLIYVFFREKHERQLLEKERTVNAAQAKIYAQQMQPHFIFNSLMAIETLVRTDPDKAEECIENLSGYLRGNIDALMSDKWIPFSMELSHIREFVTLELADPSRQFAIEYDLEVQDFTIPALTIQPIVENAVKHGALSRKDGTGRVRLKTERHGSMIRILVEDNGVGYRKACDTDSASAPDRHPEEVDDRESGHPANTKEHEGVGLRSAKNRILIQCGGSFHFEQGEDGARTVILIPVRG